MTEQVYQELLKLHDDLSSTVLNIWDLLVVLPTKKLSSNLLMVLLAELLV